MTGTDASATVANTSQVAALLDAIIPSEDQLPSAGMPELVEAFLADVAEDESEGVVVRVLTQLPIDFPELDREVREDLARKVQDSNPRDFDIVLRHTYNAYYASTTVRDALEQTTGYPARPPNTAGYELASFDENTLVTQRARAPFWRRV